MFSTNVNSKIFYICIIFAILISLIWLLLLDNFNYLFLNFFRPQKEKIFQYDDTVYEFIKKNKNFYSARKNMSVCLPIFGKIMILVLINDDNRNGYTVAQESLHCYVKSTNYTYKLINIDYDERTKLYCNNTKHFLFKRHCTALSYLNDTDWMFVLGADNGVINPNHCIEEWIDDRVNIIFYDRIISSEIMADSYLIRNSDFSRKFLNRWIALEKRTVDLKAQFKNTMGYDNGALNLVLLKILLPHAKEEYRSCDSLYGGRHEPFIQCVKYMLGSTYFWPNKIRVYRKGHGWARDGIHTSDNEWCEKDFMMHDWKGQDISKLFWYNPVYPRRELESPFTKPFNLSECGNGYRGWYWRESMKKSTEEIRIKLAEAEKRYQVSVSKVSRVIPYLDFPNIGECYPNCEIL